MRGDRGKLVECDSHPQINVTNAAALIYNPAHHGKPRNALPSFRPSRHDHSQPARQTERLDGHHGRRSPRSDRRGGARRKRSCDCPNGRRARILRGRGYFALEHGRREGTRQSTAGPSSATWEWRPRRCASGLPEEILVFPGGYQAGDCGH